MLNYRKEDSYIAVKKPGRQHLNQVIKINILTNKKKKKKKKLSASCYDSLRWPILSMVFLSKMNNLNFKTTFHKSKRKFYQMSGQ